MKETIIITPMKMNERMNECSNNYIHTNIHMHIYKCMQHITTNE